MNKSDDIKAVLTIIDAKDMTDEEKMKLTNWLQRQAHDFLLHGEDYAEIYRANFIN